MKYRGGCRADRGAERGQSLAEFALTFAVLMLIILGIVDFSRAVLARNVIASAAREAARYGTVAPSDDEGIAAVATRQAAAAGFAVTVKVKHPGQSIVDVEVSTVFRPVSLWIATYTDSGGGAGLTLRANSRMAVESAIAVE